MSTDAFGTYAINQLIHSICVLCRALARWEENMRPSDEVSPVHAEPRSLTNMFITSVDTLTAALPDTGQLSKSFLLTVSNKFQAVSEQVPRLTAHGQAGLLPVAPTGLPSHGDSLDLWVEVKETLSTLGVSLFDLAVQPVDNEDGDNSFRAFIQAARISAFLLMVNVLVRGYDVPSVQAPSDWSPRKSASLLLKTRAVLLASLALAPSNSVAIPDAAMQWILYALASANQDPLAAALDSATVSTLCTRLIDHIPTALGWPARVALRDLLAHHAGSLAVHLLHDWCDSNEAGGRPAMAFALARDAASVQRPLGTLWSPELANSLLPLVEGMAADPFPLTANASPVQEFDAATNPNLVPLLSRADSLREAVHWLYFCLSSNHADRMGLRSGLDRIKEHIYAPLHAAVVGWNRTLAQVLDTDQNYAEARKALDLLDLALARLLGVLGEISASDQI